MVFISSPCVVHQTLLIKMNTSKVNIETDLLEKFLIPYEEEEIVDGSPLVSNNIYLPSLQTKAPYIGPECPITTFPGDKKLRTSLMDPIVRMRKPIPDRVVEAYPPAIEDYPQDHDLYVDFVEFEAFHVCTSLVASMCNKTKLLKLETPDPKKEILLTRFEARSMLSALGTYFYHVEVVNTELAERGIIVKGGVVFHTWLSNTQVIKKSQNKPIKKLKNSFFLIP